MAAPVSRSRSASSTTGRGAGRRAHPGPISLVTPAGAVHRTARHPPSGGHAVTNASANQTETTKLTQATYDRLHGRARGPDHPGPGRDRPGHRGRPGPRRPVRERRLPRRQGHPGEDGGPDPPAPGHAQARRDRRRVRRRRRVRSRWAASVDPPLRGRRRGRPQLLRGLDRGAPGRAATWSPPAPRSARRCWASAPATPSSTRRRAACSRSQIVGRRTADGRRPAPSARRSGTRHVVHARRGRARPALHRPAPGARGHVAAGLRRAAPGRAHGAPARPHRGHGRPQRADHRHRQAGRRPGLGPAARGPRRQLAPSSASPATRWATPTRASSTSSGPSWAGPSPA